MAMAPFGTRPVTPARTPASESRRRRLAVAIATLGIAATLLAYAVSPGVRHAVHVLEDLGSGNGTSVNGSAVQKAALRSQDRIQVGDQRLRFAQPT